MFQIKKYYKSVAAVYNISDVWLFVIEGLAAAVVDDAVVIAAVLDHYGDVADDHFAAYGQVQFAGDVVALGDNYHCLVVVVLVDVDSKIINF